MANRHMKRCSASLTIRKIQIKTTMRYYLMPVRMAGIKKAKNNKWWQKCEEKRTLQHLDFPSGSTVKNLWAMQETRVISLGWEDPLEGRVWQPTQVILLGKKNPIEEPGRLQSMRLQSVRSNRAHPTVLWSDGAATKRRWRVLRLRLEPPYDPAIPLLGFHAKKTKTLLWKDTRNRIFITVLYSQ